MKKNNNIEMDKFYDFFGINTNDSIESIRKMYTYYRSFAIRYNYTIANYDYDIGVTARDGYCARAFLEKAVKQHQTLIRLMDESYLAILLQRFDYEAYKFIIKGLYGYFEHSDCEINPSLKYAQYKKYEKIMAKENYLNWLIAYQHPSTSVGEYLDTFSLGSIIEIEKEIIKPDEMVKRLVIDQEIPYGDLDMFKKN